MVRFQHKTWRGLHTLVQNKDECKSISLYHPNNIMPRDLNIINMLENYDELHIHLPTFYLHFPHHLYLIFDSLVHLKFVTIDSLVIFK